jgi:hypothetical protein
MNDREVARVRYRLGERELGDRRQQPAAFQALDAGTMPPTGRPVSRTLSGRRPSSSARSGGVGGRAIQPGTDIGTRRGLIANTRHRLLEARPGPNAVAKLEQAIQ